MPLPVILVTGAGGLLGPYLVEAAETVGKPVSVARSGGDFRCDLGDADAVHAVIEDVNPDIVLHAAAMTNVDDCEANPDAAERANHLATANIATALPSRCRLVVYSTIAVYPDTAGPHVEGSEAPVNVYGKTKLAGERAALEKERTLVLRTMLFGPSRTKGRISLSDFVISNLSSGKPITLFSDVKFSPLHLQTMAEITFEAVEAGLTGVYNAGTRDGMTKAEFGGAVAQAFGLSTQTMKTGISTSVPGRAPRARDTRLDSRKLATALGREMPSVAEEIAKL